tara:strand:- start:16 stop:192 length:177 start_codon:yes stop_codon:yes gene_type:complete
MSKNDFWDFEFLVVVVLKRVVVVLGLFFRKKSVVVVFGGSGLPEASDTLILYLVSNSS